MIKITVDPLEFFNWKTYNEWMADDTPIYDNVDSLKRWLSSHHSEILTVNDSVHQLLNNSLDIVFVSEEHYNWFLLQQ